ncbi:helix-turn-helix transcriptional regulator [Aeromicrobium sp. 179-A 4D2 NHS]|uniref:helix-turn-helix transcriptional regulator n=1 Tax=Aeromicrobium sp. 179-A 4D2 NHS TaxID=3142375 RepID=UPI0039A144C0
MNDDLAARVRAIREQRSLTQSSLAREMQRMGFPWRPQTVVKIEAGDRGLKFEEGLALSTILSVDPGMLAGLAGSLSDPALRVQDMTRAFRVSLSEANECASAIAKAREGLDTSLEHIIRGYRDLAKREDEARHLAARHAEARKRLDEVLADHGDEVPSHVAGSAELSEQMVTHTLTQMLSALEEWQRRWDELLDGLGMQIRELAVRLSDGQ